MRLRVPSSKQKHFNNNQDSPVVAPGFIPRGRFLTINGLRTHVVIRGSGSPVILVHGLASYLYCWRHNLEELAKHHQIFALDLPGFGFSEKPARRNYSLRAQADFIKSFMDEMGLTQASLIGNSMGGGIALEFAIRYPERLKALIILGSVGIRKDHFPMWVRGVTARVVRGGPATSLMIPGRRRLRWLMSYLYHDPSKIQSEDIEAFLIPLRTPEFKRALSSMIRTLYLKLSDSQRLSQIKHPTLILWGEEDRVMPKELAEKFNSALPNSTMIIVPEAGHALNQEQPEIVNRHMLDFLKQLND